MPSCELDRIIETFILNFFNMSNPEVRCPLCDESFPASKIEIHADKCIQSSTNANKEDTLKASSPTGTKRKRSNDVNKQMESLQVSYTDTSTTPPRHNSNNGLGTSIKKQWSFLGQSQAMKITTKNDNFNLSSSIVTNETANNNSSGKHSSKISHNLLKSRNMQKEDWSPDCGVPLAEAMRPRTLDDFVGQQCIEGETSLLRSVITTATFVNLILWGPPGCGKTTLANIIAEKCRSSNDWRYVCLSACTSGVQDVRNVVQEAKSHRTMTHKKTLLFVDEVHRFNKTQQDSFLPHVESGLITLIGATTENPSFSLNSALISRCRVIVLNALSAKCVYKVLIKAYKSIGGIIVNEASMKQPDTSDSQTDPSSDDDDDDDDDEDNKDDDVKSRVRMSKGTMKWLSEASGGDARSALNALQLLLSTTTTTNIITHTQAEEALKRSHVLYDRKGDMHYNYASALQKSIRGGDDNAALYWTMRMIQGGEDPRFIARRLIRTAAEDVGLGDPQAVGVAVSAMQAVEMLGMPEADVILGQCAVYLARATHNPQVYQAMGKIKSHFASYPGELPPVPLQLRNASTKLMKSLGYGSGYSNHHEDETEIDYLPAELKRLNFLENN